jgi:hypothetical protein
MFKNLWNIKILIILIILIILCLIIFGSCMVAYKHKINNLNSEREFIMEVNKFPLKEISFK